MNNPRFKYADKGDSNIHVKLDGRSVGIIRRRKGKWIYCPQGKIRAAGDPFATLAECKESIEEE